MSRHFESVILVTLVLCAAFGGAAAPPAAALEPLGGGWFWQNPQPSGWMAERLEFTAGGDLWASDWGGSSLRHSSDGGRTWATVHLDRSMQMDGVSFVDGLHGWVAGFESGDDGPPDAILLRTTDGGATWQPTVAPITNTNVCIDFVSPSEGWFGGGGYSDTLRRWVGRVFHTTDGGATWTEQAVAAVPMIGRLEFTDAQHGWALAGKRVLHTSDGGATWTSQILPAPGRVNDFAAGDADHVVAFLWRDSSGTTPELSSVLSTTDGGATWQAVGIPVGLDFRTVAAYGQNEILVLGDPQTDAVTMRRSSDGGASWNDVTVPGGFPSWTLALGPSGAGCAGGWGGQNGGLWGSNDGGLTWEPRRSTIGYSLAAVTFTGTNDGWAVGAGDSWSPYAPNASWGVMLKTTDGERWSDVAIPACRPLRAVTFFGVLDGWAVGARGSVLHTSDGGATWVSQTSGTTCDLHDVCFVNAQQGWAIGGDDMDLETKPVILHTSDGGATWSQQAPLPLSTTLEMPTLAAVSFTDADHGCIVGSMGLWWPECLVLTTSDGGATWLGGDLGEWGSLTDVTFTDAAHGLAVGFDEAEYAYDTTVYRTSDGGSTWARAWSNNTHDLSALTMAGADNGWLVGEGIFRTTDGGDTWKGTGDGACSDIGGDTLSSVAWAGPGRLWAVGPNGLILTTVDSASDSARPTTFDDGDGLWHNTAVTITLRAADIGTAGLERTEFRVDGDPAWQTGTTVTLQAPPDHSGDGRHTVSYRSVDMVGNAESAQRCPVLIDTEGPWCSCRTPDRVFHAGKPVRLSYSVYDGLSSRVRVTASVIRLDRQGMHVVRRLRARWCAEGARVAWDVGSKLRPGLYFWQVKATDEAGNQQSTIGIGMFGVE